MEQELRVIISGGGTGGHIFPALSIANAIKAKRPDAKLLFVGELGCKECPLQAMKSKDFPLQVSTESTCSRMLLCSTRYGRVNAWLAKSFVISSLWWL